MRVLLLSMPDSFEHTPPVAMRMPNGALASLAGNVDPHHRVAIADLILARSDVPGTVERLVHELQPDLVGLSVMTFQRKTALKLIALIRSLRPGVRVVVGGYDASLAAEVYETPAGVANHWKQTQAWEEFAAVVEWTSKVKVTTVHGAPVVHSLW